MESKYGPQGLRKQHTYEEVVNYIVRDPDTVKFPDRKALQTINHPYYGALLDNIRNNEDAKLQNEQAYLDYRKSNELGPYDPGYGRYGSDIFFSPPASDIGEVEGLLEVIEDEEIPRPQTLPDPAGGDSMALGYLREGLRLPSTILQRAGSAVGSIANGVAVGASEAAAATATAAGTVGNVAVAGASEAVGFAVDAGIAAMNSQIAEQVGNKFGRLGRLAFNRIANPGNDAIVPVGAAGPYDQPGPIERAVGAAATGATLSGIAYGLGAGTPAGALVGSTAALVGGARLVAGQVMRNRNRQLNHEDMMRDAAIHVFDRGQPAPLLPLRDLNGMNEGHRPIDRRPVLRALPSPQQFYIGQNPDGEPDTPPDATGPNFDPLVLPSSRITMQMDPSAGPPLPQAPPASYRDLARQGRAEFEGQGSSSSSSQMPMVNRRNAKPKSAATPRRRNTKS